MSIIKHRRSSTAQAKPTATELQLGEIAVNTRDGLVFIKKNDSTVESIVEFRGAIDEVRPTGQTSSNCPSETAVREAIEAISNDLIPNYFVNGLQEFLNAYNTIRSSYPGGNIYVLGELIMTSDLTLDLAGINIFGMGCNWRFYNGTDLIPSTVYKIIITNGSPTFTGINFWGSNGSKYLQMENAVTRLIFSITPTWSGVSKYITFRDCRFTDVVGGYRSTVMLIDAPMDDNAGINITFDGCRVASHGTLAALTGFMIYYEHATQCGLITINVRNQIPSAESDLSLYYIIASKFGNVSWAFNSDETAWIDEASDLTDIGRTNSVLQAPPLTTFNPADSYFLLSTGLGKNIYRLPASLFSGGYVHPNGFSNVPASVLSGAYVISQILVNSEGHVTGVNYRQITSSDIGAQPSISLNSGVLMGRYSAGAGAFQQITLGSGLQFYNGQLICTASGGGLTSVGIFMPSNLFNVVNSPLIANGNISVELHTQAAGSFFAAPALATGAPGFRAIAVSDLPSLAALYDKYKSWTLNIDYTSEQEITSARRVVLEAGTGVTLDSKVLPDGSVVVTINASSSGGGVANNIENVSLNAAMSSIAAATWTDVTGIEINILDSGDYYVSANVLMQKNSTGTAIVAARLIAGSTYICSAEQYATSVSTNRVSFSLSGRISVKDAGATIKLQVWANTTGWFPSNMTASSSSYNATQMSVIRMN